MTTAHDCLTSSWTMHNSPLKTYLKIIVPLSVPSDDHSCWSWTMHNGHVTICFVIGHFLPVVLWNEAFISMVSEIFNGECNKLIDMTLNDL